MSATATLRDCPLCGTPDPHVSVRREGLPIMQNVTYATREEALAAVQAPFALGTCAACGFSFDAVFDPALMVYDERYDNHVQSSVFDAYYEQLAQALLDRLNIKDGVVYDIGCGRGTFLRTLCRLAPDVRGVGIDPSCTPIVEGNLELIRDEFRAEHFASGAKLVILRHVLEHISQPVAFLAAIREAIGGAPLFVELPDLSWTLANGAFWDFCYEHCNYFRPETLAFALRQAGFDVVDQQLAFGDQYQWALARAGGSAGQTADSGAAAAAAAAYAREESRRITALQARAEASPGLAIWGMSTKGVLLATMLGGERVAAAIDMNPAKQGRYAAVSGVRIDAPEGLAALPAGAEVLAMNPNYLDEIRRTVAQVRDDVATSSV